MSPRRRPRAGLLLLLLALVVALPVAGALGWTPVGAFRMFAAPQSYRLTLITRPSEGPPRPLPLRTLAPHLGRDARRHLLDASGDRLGDAHVALLADGLADVARLACAVRPDAVRVEVYLQRRDARGDPLPERRYVGRCDER